jgi:hypothetical protein
MPQASRLLVIGFLALVQTFAPLVHAHAGGAAPAGFAHVPGLEFLAGKAGVGVRAQAAQEAFGLVVGLAPGLENRAARGAPVPDWGLAPAPALPIPSRAPAHSSFIASSRPRSRIVWLAASPRAPPEHAPGFRCAFAQSR